MTSSSSRQNELIKDLVDNHGYRYEDFLEIPLPLKTRYIVIPAGIFFLSLIVLVFIRSYPSLWRLFFIICFTAGTWLCFSVHIRFKNGTAITILCVGLIVALLLAGGVINPKEIAIALKVYWE